MLSVSRRLVVALLGLAMSSQIVQGQLRPCGEMNMGDTSSQSMPAGEHADHDLLPATASTSGVAGLDLSTQLPDCVPSAGCMNPPAVPVIPDITAEARNRGGSDPAPPSLPGLPFLGPDLPPPRV